jgi:large subunit ribosomal protein L24
LFPNTYCALVKGINVKKKHQKPSKEQKGGIVNIEKPVHLSNLKVVEVKKDSKITKKIDTKKFDRKKIIENKIKEKKTTINTKNNKGKKGIKSKKGKK